MRVHSAPINIEILESSNDGALSAQDVLGAGLVAWVPKDYTNGLVLSKDTDATNDINVTLGDCADSGNAYILKLLAEITKQADNTWAEGDDAGGTRSGDHPISDSTQYYIYLMRKDDDGTLDVIFSSEASSPTLPSGYTAHRQIGRFYRDAVPANTNIVYNIDANTEIGEWTPTIHDGSNSDGEGQTYSLQKGNFTKIGTEVLLTGVFVLTSIGSLTGGDNARLAGLPFVAAGAAAVSGSLSGNYGEGLAITATGNIGGRISATNSHFLLNVWDGATGTTAMSVTEVSADGGLYITGHYQTT